MNATELEKILQANETERGGPLARGLAYAQGGWWLATGLWPVLHLRSFERVTGRKREGWLVKTLGGLIAAVGGVMLLSAKRSQVTPELRLLGLGSALAMAVSDVWYPLRGRVKKVYLADAAAEAALVGGWLLASSKRQQEKHAARAKLYVAELLSGKHRDASSTTVVAPV